MPNIANLQLAVEQKSVDGFEAFCLTLKLENSRPLVLFPEQKLMLADYFGGARETVILIPKKNGKTTLLAGLALYHLLTTHDAMCVIGASSRDQASILYEQATGLVERSGLLSLFNSGIGAGSGFWQPTRTPPTG